MHHYKCYSTENRVPSLVLMVEQQRAHVPRYSKRGLVNVYRKIISNIISIHNVNQLLIIISIVEQPGYEYINNAIITV